MQRSKLDHALKLMSSLENMREKTVVCDFEVRAAGNIFPVHRAVLVACSQYFEVMFSSNMKETRQGYVDMIDTGAEEVESCIRFMYTGEVSITPDSILPLIKLSHRIQLDDLTKLCLQSIKETLDGDTCLHALEICKLYGSDDDITAAENYVINNMEDVLESEAFLLIPKQDLLRYLRNCAILSVHWNAMVKWMQHEEHQNDDFLMSGIRIMLATKIVSLIFLLQVIWNHPRVQSSATAKSILLATIAERDVFLEESMNVGTCLRILNIIEEYKAIDNCQAALSSHNYVANNFNSAITHDRYRELSLQNFLKLLHSANISSDSEELKWKALVTWIEGNGSRDQYMPELMKEINFENLSEAFIDQNIKINPLVKRSAECVEIVFSALLAKTKVSSDEVNPSSSTENRQALVMMESQIGSLQVLDLNDGRHRELARFQETDAGIVSTSKDLYLLHNKDIYLFTRDGKWQRRAWRKRSLGLWCPVLFLDKIYLVGDQGMSFFDPMESKFTEGLPGCKFELGFSVAASKYVIYALEYDSRKVARFSPSTNEWTEICPTLQSRRGAAAVVYRGILVVAGGCDVESQPQKHSNSVEMYRPATNSWSYAPRMNNSRVRFSIVEYKGKLHAVGGACNDLGEPLTRNSIEIYDVASRTWQDIAPLNSSEGKITSSVVDLALLQRLMGMEVHQSHSAESSSCIQRT